MTDQHDERGQGMRPDTLRRVALGVAALIFGGLGSFFLGWPVEMAGQVQLVVEGPAALTEIRAMYGGLQVGFATFLLLCVVLRRWLVAGLVAVGLVCTGLAGGRIFGVLVDQPDDPVVWMLLAAEVAGALVVGVVLWVARRRKPSKRPAPEPSSSTGKGTPGSSSSGGSSSSSAGMPSSSKEAASPKGAPSSKGAGSGDTRE